MSPNPTKRFDQDLIFAPLMAATLCWRAPGFLGSALYTAFFRNFTS